MLSRPLEFGPGACILGRMRFIRDIHQELKAMGQPVISIEFFPPKTAEGDRNLLENTIPALMKLRPDYCSVTYGAGGSTREKTLGLVDRIQREHQLTAMAHLTCVNATVAQIGDVMRQAAALNIKNILALRGDPPGGTGDFVATEGGFEYSYQLIRYLRQHGDFCIGTAGFPEGHIACKGGKHADWSHLKAKIDEGADFVLTQLFFDNADFFEFRDWLVKAGVTIPICPGILPVMSGNQIKRFTSMCGARLPKPFLEKIESYGEDDAAVTEFGIEYATRQCEELIRAGAPGLHLYTLNKAYSVSRIVRNLRVRPGL